MCSSTYVGIFCSLFSARKEEKGTEEPEVTAASKPVPAKKPVEVKVTKTQKTVEGTKQSVRFEESQSSQIKVTEESSESESLPKVTKTQKPAAVKKEEPGLKQSKPAEEPVSKKRERETEPTVPVTEKQKPSKPTSLFKNKVAEEVVSKPKAKVESSSSSSESTLRQSSFALLTATSTTSEAETLKQVQTPESETVDTEAHFHRIQAVEPLVQINKPRVLEEVLPYVIKPPPELVPGSAINKVYSVEKRGASEVVLTDFEVGVEVNVEVGNEMSRRYTSSAGWYRVRCCVSFSNSRLFKTGFPINNEP